MAVTYRVLTPDDESILWQGLFYALYTPAGADPLEPSVVHHPSLAPYVEGWTGDSGELLGFVAEVQGDAVGVAWLRRWTTQVRGFGFVDTATPELSMAVWPGHRGQGIGTRLLTLVLAAAVEHHSAVSLSVSLENPALRLYRRLGFVTARQAKDGSLTMVKNVAAPHP